jgi:phosphohistidine phosphatase SixA
MVFWIAFLLSLQAPPQGSEAVAAAIDAARKGGVVIACRHGITNQSDPEDETTLRYDEPSTQRRLSADGERQGQDVGAAMRQLGIRFAEVIASPMQRARRSAELMAGEARLDSLWHTRGENYEPKRAARRVVLSQTVSNGNRLIVSHVGTLTSVLQFRGSMAEGDCAVVRPLGDRYEVIGLVPWAAWSKHERRP